MSITRTTLRLILVTVVGALAGCKYEADEPYVVQIAGSSTVSPVSSGVAEESEKVIGVRATVESTGTGPGIDKLSKKECDISGASRPIKTSEIEKCQANGVTPLELPICIDGISVVTHPDNDWCTCLSVAQLKRLWAYESDVKTWKDLDPTWPDEQIKLFGPDHESGTFDYFIEAIIGDVPEGQSPCRTDYTQSVNDTVLVDGVKGSKYALGYFGYAYYVMNQQQLNVVGISAADDKSACVVPNAETIGSGEYAPLSRPLFIYVNTESLLQHSEVAQFVEFYLGDGQAQVAESGYIELPAEKLVESRARLQAALEGTDPVDAAATPEQATE